MKTILLVEDDPFLVEIYSAKFKEAGFNIDVAVDGEQCLKKIEENPPDLVLLDVVLPNVDGWEVLRKIGKSEGVKSLKVVVLSNLGQKEEVQKGLKLGAVKYLIKAHHTPSEVVAEVDKLLK